MTGIGSVLVEAYARSIFRGAGRFRIGVAPGLAAVLAVGFPVLVSVPLSPVSAAVTCDSAWTPGTLDSNGNWRAGAGLDYRIQCTADTDGDAVTVGDVPPVPLGNTFVIDVSDANIDSLSGTTATGRAGRLVVTGQLGSATGDSLSYTITEFEAAERDAEFLLESFATIVSAATGGHAIVLESSDTNHDGTIKAINRGRITTAGSDPAYGVIVVSTSSASADNRSSITTSGDGGRGIVARVITTGVGTATATNSGEIGTSGGVAEITSGTDTAHIASDGVLAINDSGGDATASNAAGGTVKVTGDGASGVGAVAATARGNAEATNAGSVRTEGEAYVDSGTTICIGPHGVFALAQGDGNATATNAAGGTVDTAGKPAMGVAAQADGSGAAMVTNAGTVVTHATESIADLPGEDEARSAHGLFASSETGLATIVNEASGSVTTSGAGAVGMLASGYRGGSVTVMATNEGRVATEGAEAHAVLALATGDSAARAYNKAGATISTKEDGAGGLGAAILMPSGGRSAGTASVENHGTITTEGDNGAWGMNASFLNPDEVSITAAGNARAENTGTITVNGAGAEGIRAATFLSGAATVVVDGGRVYATHDSMTDSEDGVGILAATGGGRVTVTIEDRALIEAPQALDLTGGPIALNVTDSVVRGRMSFGSGTTLAQSSTLTITNGVLLGDIALADGEDTLQVRGAATIAGDIEFGAESTSDGLTLDVDRSSTAIGDITGLNTLLKRSPGDFVFDGDVTFDAGTSNTVSVTAGGLVLTGHMNLGASGTVTVARGARLIALLTETGTPRITATGLTVERTLDSDTNVTDEGYVVVQAHADAGTVDAAKAIVTFLKDANVTNVLSPGEGAPASQKIMTQHGEGPLTELAAFIPAEGGMPARATVAAGASVGTRSADPFLDADEIVSPLAGTGGGGGGGGGGGDGGGSGLFVVGGAALAALIYVAWELDFDDLVFAAPQNPALAQTVDRASGYWVRDLAQALPRNGAGAASGTEFGANFAVGNGFVLGLSASPDAALKQTIAGSHQSSFSGARYALKGGWQGETLFGGARLSHARWGVASAYGNPTVGGGLTSRYAANQTDLQLGLGARLDLGAVLTVTPSAGGFAGEVKHEAHTAEGPVFNAAMPDVVQRYGGWRVGLNLASEWQDGPGDVKLRPSLKLSAARVWTDSPDFTLRQSDRLGFLSTASRARLPNAPGTVLGLATGLDTTVGDGIGLGIGYGGLVLDGEFVHAAFAKAKLSF